MGDKDEISRSYSDKFVPGMSEYDVYKNKNVDWMSGPFTRWVYIIFIFLIWSLLHFSRKFSPEDCWTATNVIHGVLSFIFFHWIKGNPDESTQGEYNGLTVYEQLDAGVPYTRTKKFLMLVPSFMTWMAVHVSDYKPLYVIVNCSMFLIMIVAKLPEMHRIRVFGINSTPGIDTPVSVDRSNKKKK